MSRRVKWPILSTNEQMVLHEEEEEFLQQLVQVPVLPTPPFYFSISRNVKEVWSVSLGVFKY